LQIGTSSTNYWTYPEERGRGGAVLLGILLQLIVIEIPFLQCAFHLQMFDLEGWIINISLGLVPLRSMRI
jgi:hypothetical protein